MVSSIISLENYDSNIHRIIVFDLQIGASDLEDFIYLNKRKIKLLFG